MKPWQLAVKVSVCRFVYSFVCVCECVWMSVFVCVCPGYQLERKHPRYRSPHQTLPPKHPTPSWCNRSFAGQACSITAGCGSSRKKEDRNSCLPQGNSKEHPHTTVCRHDPQPALSKTFPDADRPHRSSTDPQIPPPKMIRWSSSYRWTNTMCAGELLSDYFLSFGEGWGWGWRVGWGGGLRGVWGWGLWRLIKWHCLINNHAIFYVYILLISV